jgi:hypothetical protein
MSRKSAKQQQRADTEKALTSLRATSLVAAHLMKQWSISERTAMRWIAEVRATWGEEAKLVDRDSKRTDMRQTLGMMITSAMTRTELVRDADRQYVFAMERVTLPNGEIGERRKLDKNGHPIPMTRAKPDIRAALYACAQLRALDALDEEHTTKLVIDDMRDSIPDLSVLDAEQYEKLQALLHSVAPNSDLRTLAGELFRDPNAVDGPLN